MSSGNTKQAVAEQKSKSDTDKVILIVNWFIIIMIVPYINNGLLH